MYAYQVYGSAYRMIYRAFWLQSAGSHCRTMDRASDSCVGGRGSIPSQNLFQNLFYFNFRTNDFPICSKYITSGSSSTWCHMYQYDVRGNGMTWQGMRWSDVTWHDITWRDAMWCDMTWYDWRDVTCLAWHDLGIEVTNAALNNACASLVLIRMSHCTIQSLRLTFLKMAPFTEFLWYESDMKAGYSKYNYVSLCV